jgi:uncharacterized protein (DUF1778 family)
VAGTARRTRSPERERKRERIELRVAPSAKKLIQRAMAVSGLTAGDLAYEGARRVLDEHERMVLTGADKEAFLRALLDPPPPTPRLVRPEAPSRPFRIEGVGDPHRAARQ